MPQNGDYGCGNELDGIKIVIISVIDIDKPLQVSYTVNIAEKQPAFLSVRNELQQYRRYQKAKERETNNGRIKGIKD